LSVYLVIEGPDGCGKTAQAREMVAWLRARGRAVEHLREPGSTPLGEELRRLLLAPSTGDLLPVTEALLFSAARAEMVRHEVTPALARGVVVVAERCYFSTLVYQGMALYDGTDDAALRALTGLVHGATLPDLVIVLDVDAATAATRRSRRHPDRIEKRDESFHERVRAGFRSLAASEPNAVLVDARPSLAEVAASVRGVVTDRLRVLA
jgi:dTMP kinase